MVLAELRRPEGQPRESPESHAYIKIENHTARFSRSRAYALRKTTTSRNMAAIFQLMGRARHAVEYIFDIGHLCYGQNKVSADQYQVTMSRAYFRSL